MLQNIVKRQSSKLPQPLPQPRQVQMLDLLPDRQTCGRLCDIYFDNLEHCFRILHRPTFEAHHELFWNGFGSQDSVPPDFLPQLIGVLCGASLLGSHHECLTLVAKHGDYASIAIGAMQVWLNEVSHKHKYRLPVLQVYALTLLNFWMRANHIDDLWSTSGTIVRFALIMRLDRDPDELSDVSVFEGELRRRVWMTIVEQDLMLSVLCGMPSLIPEYTCRSPSNLNDVDLYQSLTILPRPKPIQEWTDTLCQSVLAQSLHQRLRVHQYVFNNQNLDYDRVLSYSRYLEQVLRDLTPPLRFDHVKDDGEKTPGRLMARMELDISIRRPLMLLYMPFALAMPEDDRYREARLGCIQSCLMLTIYQDLFDPRFSELNVPFPEGFWDFFYNVYRHELNQAVLGLCLEIKRLNSTSETATLINSRDGIEGSSKAPTWTKNGLIHNVKDGIEPMVRRVSRPGANMKDIAYLTIVFNNVRTNHTKEKKEELVKEGLREMIEGCKAQFRRNGIHIPDILTLDMDTPFGTVSEAGAEGMPCFDPSWAGFPDAEFAHLGFFT